MLGDDGWRAVGRHGLQQLPNRFGATGRCADGQQLVCGRNPGQHTGRPGADGGQLSGLRRCARSRSGSGRGLDLEHELLGVVLQAVGDVDLGFRDEIDRSQFQRCQRDLGPRLGSLQHIIIRLIEKCHVFKR